MRTHRETALRFEANPLSRHEELRSGCNAFHRSHPEVWRLFVRFTFEKLDLGYRHFGAKAVMERVRWETAAGGSMPELKLNNNYTAFYARRFARMYPEHADFFRTRVQTSHITPARVDA